MKAYKEVRACRICGNGDLVPILSLGVQALTGIFPKPGRRVSAGPMDLVRCDASKGKDRCGLVQLKQSYDTNEMYGRDYGYHSGLNKSMVEHLHAKVAAILAKVEVVPGDLIIDIGANDSTLLQGYPAGLGLTLVGIDPTGAKFKRFYPPHVRLIPEFFSAEAVRRHFGDKKAKIVTSIAMFYDLEAPGDFMAQVRGILALDGVWVLEQSYLPAMLKMNAYDTICHEHLEYYGLKQIKWMADRVGLKIIDVEANAVNGGSFSVMLAREDSPRKAAAARVAKFLRAEKGLDTQAPYEAFRKRVFAHRKTFQAFLKKARAQKKTVMGLGASTKGNVILQFCGVTTKDLSCIGEVNPDKFGCVTPGGAIPIIPEPQAKAKRPDYLLVLPWHFKEFFLKKEAEYLRSGGKLVFPLPRCQIHG